MPQSLVDTWQEQQKQAIGIMLLPTTTVTTTVVVVVLMMVVMAMMVIPSEAGRAPLDLGTETARPALAFTAAAAAAEA